MDFKFVSHVIWSKKQNILEHMHGNESSILTNKCGNNKFLVRLHGEYNILVKLVKLCSTKLTDHGPSASFSYLRLFPHLLVKIQTSFLCMC